MKKIDDLILIEFKKFEDERGFFEIVFDSSCDLLSNFNIKFVQLNRSFSKTSKTLRGLHFQRYPHAQAKFVTCVKGAIYDVVIDIRPDSNTFGLWNCFELNANSQTGLFIPKGFAHGFMTLSNTAEFLYKTTDYYSPDHECSIHWNDSSIGIKWPITTTNPILSLKDNTAPEVAGVEIFQ